MDYEEDDDARLLHDVVSRIAVCLGIVCCARFVFFALSFASEGAEVKLSWRTQWAKPVRCRKLSLSSLAALPSPFQDRPLHHVPLCNHHHHHHHHHLLLLLLGLVLCLLAEISRAALNPLWWHQSHLRRVLLVSLKGMAVGWRGFWQWVKVVQAGKKEGEDGKEEQERREEDTIQQGQQRTMCRLSKGIHPWRRSPSFGGAFWHACHIWCRWARLGCMRRRLTVCTHF